MNQKKSLKLLGFSLYARTEHFLDSGDPLNYVEYEKIIDFRLSQFLIAMINWVNL